MQTLYVLAVVEETATSSLPEALGIDWRILLLQAIAFLILVWFLGKFVFPVLNKAIDDRQSAIEQGAKAAEEAQQKAAATEADVNKLFKDARAQADEIVQTAHKEAISMIESAETKAKKRADHVVGEARAQLDQDVAEARTALRSETAELVALATEQIVKQKVDARTDSTLIERALKEAR